MHSDLLDPFLDEFGEALRDVKLRTPETPFVSNVTGTWARAEDVTDPRYWVRHLRQTVHFSDGMATLLSEPNRLLVEVGPGNTLTALARQLTASPIAAVSSLPHVQNPAPSDEFMLTSLGRVWCSGVGIE